MTPRLGTNTEQTLVWNWSGDAFGSTAPSLDTTEVNLRFPGQYYDTESGLHYNWNRYYNPTTGRYIASDSVGLRGGLNTYLYTAANPIRHIDPQGLYFPSNLPDNCNPVILKNESSSEIKSEKDDPEMYHSEVVYGGIKFKIKKVKLTLFYTVNLYWKQVTRHYLVTYKFIDYYVRCVDIDECGNEIVVNHAPGGPHEEYKEEQLPDTVEKWVDQEFDFIRLPRKRR